VSEVSGTTPEILVVDDRAQDAELVVRALRKRRPDVTTMILRDGAELLAFIEGLDGRVPPRVILLDLKMPKVDGFEVLERLKRDSDTRDIPIVVLTSSAVVSDVRRAYRLGANSYVVKETTFEALEETIGAVGDYWCQVNHAPGDDDV
jgi:two-component system, response regulator